MSTIEADLFDGLSSEAQAVRLTLGERAEIQISGSARHDGLYSLQQLQISDRVGNIARSIQLPDGARCSIRDNEALDRFLRRQQKGALASTWHILESRLRYVVLAVAICGLSVWALLVFGVPVLAQLVVKQIPPALEQQLGEKVLQNLLSLQGLFTPASREQEQLARLRKPLAELTAVLPQIAPEAKQLTFTIHLRSSTAIGANAFTLPGAVFLFTEQLLAVVNEEELLAILAHEMGHALHQHGLRLVVQSASTALLAGLLLGDTSTLASLTIALPSLLLNQAYAREFEEEADSFAARLLEKTGRSAHLLANALQTLEQTRPQHKLPAYLSSHPPTEQRIHSLR
ncbi:M48 family metallopeptidase [Candidatus Magnetaquicoccus inordinatus]|uniref:M48 family metallopeptidase n=1 Tax=Candidatus Magnetaquicoccus inordinatus TaxID=2496818 RepID=UPI00102B8DFC|nr:M48 family metallopeptidase [Candidatus Magnetaquicoccus inordinatus]